MSTEAFLLLNAAIPIELRGPKITATRLRTCSNEFSPASLKWLAKFFPCIGTQIKVYPTSHFTASACPPWVTWLVSSANAFAPSLLMLILCVYSSDLVGSLTLSTSAFLLLSTTKVLRRFRAGLLSRPLVRQLQLKFVPRLRCLSHARLVMATQASSFSRNLPTFSSPCQLCPKCLPFTG